jgi:8-oxo-dGTP diphosphatase
LQLHRLTEAQHVVAAVIENSANEILLSLRPAHVHQAGLWEFPGGKIEVGEDARQALARELGEELGIAPLSARPMIRIRHDYPDKSVYLDVWYVDTFQGQPRGREGQEIDWVPRNELMGRKFPAANLAIVNAVRLPPVYLITPEPGDDHARFFSILEHALKSGIRLVQLRAKSYSVHQFKQHARKAIDLSRRFGAQVILNCSADLAESLGADGMHMSSEMLMSMKTRPVPEDKWLSASCHSRQEVEQAGQLGTDFIVISPVLTTSSHPDAKVLGWQGFTALCDLASMPAYALGGMNLHRIDKAWHHGAQGIAAISAIWNASIAATESDDFPARYYE